MQWNLASWMPLIMNISVHEQIFWKKKSRVTNSVSSNEHASQQQWLATSCEYRRESVSCCATFAQYTSLLKFVVPSLEFHCVLWFYYILLNKTPWDQRSFGLRTFRFTNGLQEQIKFINQGSTVLHHINYLHKSHRNIYVFMMVILHRVVLSCNRMWSCGCLNFVCFCILGRDQYWPEVAGHLTPAYGTMVDHVGIVCNPLN
jgi:hypothetical protein